MRAAVFVGHTPIFLPHSSGSNSKAPPRVVPQVEGQPEHSAPEFLEIVTETKPKAKNNIDMAEASFVTCVVIFMVAIGYAFNIASVVVAAQNSNDPCEGHDKSGVSLHGWLLVTGITGLAVNTIFCISFFGLLAFELEGCGILATIVATLSGLFYLAWFVVGIVITARSHHACVDDSTSLGVMSVIMLCLQGLSIWTGCCTKSAAASS